MPIFVVHIWAAHVSFTCWEKRRIKLYCPHLIDDGHKAHNCAAVQSSLCVHFLLEHRTQFLLHVKADLRKHADTNVQCVMSEPIIHGTHTQFVMFGRLIDFRIWLAKRYNHIIEEWHSISITRTNYAHITLRTHTFYVRVCVRERKQCMLAAKQRSIQLIAINTITAWI